MVDLHLIVSRWNALRRRHCWTLVDDESAFVAAVSASLTAMSLDLGLARAVDLAIYQEYNRRVYEALAAGLRHLGQNAITDRFNQAFEETRQMAWRMVRAKGFSRETADEVSQKVALRIVTHLHRVEKPSSFAAWVVWSVRAALKEAGGAQEAAPLDEALSGAPPLADKVIGKISDLELAELLRLVLSGFQYKVILFIIFYGIPPDEVASRLNVRVTKVYVEKSRAIAKIRGHPATRRFLGLSESPAD